MSACDETKNRTAVKFREPPEESMELPATTRLINRQAVYIDPVKQLCKAT